MAEKSARKLIFAVLYRALALQGRAGGFLVWPRNSYVLGYFSRRSDLDLTFLLKGGRVPAAHDFFCRWGCGETSVYEDRDRAWSFLANPLELERDPQLLRQFGLPRPASVSRDEAICFLFRMYASDGYLRDSSEDRSQKWNYHLRRVASLTGMNIPALPAGPVDLNFLKERFALLAGEPISLPVNEQDRFWLPHRWLAPAREAGLPLTPPTGSPLLCAVQREQIRWEMWGVLGQVRKYREIEPVIDYFQHLFLLLPGADRAHMRCEEYLWHLRSIHPGCR